MMIINRSFTTLGRLRRQSPKKTVMKRPFRGVVAPSLGVLVTDSKHQEVGGGFSPVEKDFYRPQNHLEFLNLLPAQHAETNNNYTFAPTIELTCLLQPFTQGIFSSYHTQRFQTLASQNAELSASTGDAVTSVNNHVSREFRHEQIHERRTTALLSLIRQAASSGQHSRSESTLRESHIRVQLRAPEQNKNVVPPSTQLTTLQSNFAFHRNRTNPITNLFWSTVVVNGSQELARFYRSIDNSFLVQRRTSSSTSLNNSVHFTTVSLNLGAPKFSDAEKINQRIAHFVSAPTLTYVKTQQAANETLLQTLRELRTQAPQQKPPVVMQMPTIEQLTNQVKTQIERDIRIERERRGF